MCSRLLAEVVAFFVLITTALVVYLAYFTGPLSWLYGATPIVKQFLDSFNSDQVTKKDLTAADEAVRGLTFDDYREKIFCKVLEGIPVNKFEPFIQKLSSRYEFPSDVEQSILDGLDAKVNKERIREFKFTKGEQGRVLYGKILTVKRHDSTIDLAYSFVSVKFQLSPRKYEEKIYKQFLLFFTYHSDTLIRYEDRNLSEKEREQMLDFYRAKAFEGFRKEYAALEESDKDEEEL